MKTSDQKKKLQWALCLNMIAFFLSIVRFDPNSWIGFMMIGITAICCGICSTELDLNPHYSSFQKV